MKLPHITIEYRDEESTTPGKLSAPLIVGFGLHWCWIFCVCYCTDTFFTLAGSNRAAFYLSSALCLGFTLLLYGLYSSTARQLFSTAQKRSRNRMVAALLVCVGTAALALSGNTGFLGVFATIFAGITTGIGSAVLLMSFAVSASVCDTATTSVTMALAMFVSGVFFVIVVALENLVPVIAEIIVCLLPLAVAFCLQKSSQKLVDVMSFAQTTMPIKKTRLGLRVALFCAIFGLALGISSEFAFPFSGISSVSFQTMAIQIVGAGACCLVIMTVAMLTQRKVLGYSLRTLLPVVGFCFVALMFNGISHSPQYTMFFSLLAVMALEGALWVFMADLCQQYRISPFPLFGFARSAIAFGSVLVFQFISDGSFASITAAFGDTNPNFAIALVLLLLGFSLAPRENEILNFLDRGATCPAFYRPPTIEEMLRAQSGAEEDIELPAADAPAATDVATEPEPEPADAAPAGEQLGRFKRRCATVADLYMLSARETEVLFLLAKGFNGNMIQEKLYISEGTANTHMRHVYRKLGVHSQQELIRVVESVPLQN